MLHAGKIHSAHPESQAETFRIHSLESQPYHTQAVKIPKQLFQERLQPPADLPEVKRRRLLAVTSSPRLAPASPAPSAYSDGDILEWWTPGQLHTDSPIRLALHEMRTYLADWQASTKDVFWQRKSNKAVLSILLCRSESGDWCTYHGMNTEVSLPSGSVCAERAAIVRAASDFRHAKDIVLIATLDPADKLNPLWPCEVCQSWLSKLRQENPNMMVLAFASLECHRFAIRVGGELVEPPKQLQATASPNEALSGSIWPELVELADGTTESPWDCDDVVYVDGAWNFFHPGHQRILREPHPGVAGNNLARTITKEAKQRGSHVLVGIHSDATLQLALTLRLWDFGVLWRYEILAREFCANDLFGKPSHENFGTRLGRILQSRFVSFVLKDAPWVVPQDLIQALCIKKVVTGSVDKVTDCGKILIDEMSYDPYKIPRELGILEVINSQDSITETSFQEEHKTRALQGATHPEKTA
ncbi:pctA [Symbiodinium sp. KB8]|nr:pctA [Symbiodinium sp. KB8]